MGWLMMIVVLLGRILRNRGEPSAENLALRRYRNARGIPAGATPADPGLRPSRQHKFLRLHRRADGKPYPPFVEGVCDSCGRAIATSVLHQASAVSARSIMSSPGPAPTSPRTRYTPVPPTRDCKNED